MGEKAILFGASTLGKVALEYIQETDEGYEVVAFVIMTAANGGRNFSAYQ